MNNVFHATLLFIDPGVVLHIVKKTKWQLDKSFCIRACFFLLHSEMLSPQNKRKCCTLVCCLYISTMTYTTLKKRSVAKDIDEC